jgi:RHS repeat-associated protein
MGRVTEICDFKNEVVEYSWSKTGERTSITYPDKSTVRYNYDQFNRITEVVDEDKTTAYRYDSLGHMLSRTLPNGIETHCAYNELGFIEELTHTGASGAIDSFTYHYDVAGNRIETLKSRLEKNSVYEATKHNYTYDPIGRLTGVIRNDTALRNYHYDAFGNRSVLEDLKKNNTVTYEYDPLNRLIKMSDADHTIKTFDYDPRGNLTAISKDGVLEKSFIFDATDKMIEAKTAAGDIATYTYDGADRRVKSVWDVVRGADGAIEHTERHYVFDAIKPYENVLATYGSEGTSRHVWGNELLATDTDQSDPTYYLLDELRSPVRTTDAESQSLSCLDYDEFGQLTVPDNFNTVFGYTGYQTDPITDLYYAQARYYMPDIGRFASEDIIKGNTFEPPSLNLYAYCRSNPLKYLDPDGNEVVLGGTAQDQQTTLAELQNLTDHNLTVDSNSGVVSINSTPNTTQFNSGNALVERLINSGNTCTIVVNTTQGNSANATIWDDAYRNEYFFGLIHSNNIGSDTTVNFNPQSPLATTPTIMTVDPATGNVFAAVRPNYIGLGHELIHAERAMSGRTIDLANSADYRYQIDRIQRSFLWFSWWEKIYATERERIEEYATVGLMGNDDCDITENDLRAEHGLNPRGAY